MTPIFIFPGVDLFGTLTSLLNETIIVVYVCSIENVNVKSVIETHL